MILFQSCFTLAIMQLMLISIGAESRKISPTRLDLISYALKYQADPYDISSRQKRQSSKFFISLKILENIQKLTHAFFYYNQVAASQTHATKDNAMTCRHQPYRVEATTVSVPSALVAPSARLKSTSVSRTHVRIMPVV